MLIYNFFEFVFFFTHYWWWKFIVFRSFYYIWETSYSIFNRERDILGDLDERNFIYGETGVLTTKLILQEISPEKVMELIKKNGGRISTEILDKLKNSSNQKIKVDNKKGR